MTYRNTLPFTIEPATTDYLRGIFAIRGLLRYEEGVLRLEYQTNRAGLKHSLPTTVSFPLGELDAVEYRQWFWGGKLTVRGRTLGAFGDVPGSDGGRLVLNIARGNRSEAAQLASVLQLELSDDKLRA